MVIELSKEHEGTIHLQSGKLHWDIYSPKFDLKKGFEDMLRAAECENSEAMYLVGFAYLYGDRGADKDEAKAYEWLAKAASAGNGEAQMLIAEKAQEDGDTEAAIRWYGEAEKHNVFMADEKKRLMLIKKHNSNPSDTFEWHKEGANLGIGLECYKVGMMYYQGKGIKPDYELALHYLEKAYGDSSVHAGELAKVIGDIYAFKLFQPMKAVEFYHTLDEDLMSNTIARLRSSMCLFKRIRFDSVYKRWKAIRRNKEAIVMKKQEMMYE